MGLESWGIVMGVIAILATAILGFVFWRLTSRQTEELRNFLVDAIAASTEDPDTTKRLIDDRLKSGNLRGKVIKRADGRHQIQFEMMATAKIGIGSHASTSNQSKPNLLNIGILFFGLFSYFRLILHPSPGLSYYMWAFLALSIIMAVVIFVQMLSQIGTTWPNGIIELKEGWTQLLDQIRSLPRWIGSLVQKLRNLRHTPNPQWHWSKLRDFPKFFLEALAIFGVVVAFIVGWISGMPDWWVFSLGLVWFMFIVMAMMKDAPFKWLIPACILFTVLALVSLTITSKITVWSFPAVAFYVMVFFISKFLRQSYRPEP